MNPRVSVIAPSLIRQLAAKKRPTSIDLGLGEPTLLPRIEYFERALERVRKNGVRYTANAGDPELRELVARHYAYPAMDRAENVCITIGSQEAMYVTLKTLLDPSHDELLVVEPAFPSYVKMAALEGIGVRIVSMLEDDGFAFDAAVVRERAEGGERDPAPVDFEEIAQPAAIVAAAKTGRCRARESAGRRQMAGSGPRNPPRADRPPPGPRVRSCPNPSTARAGRSLRRSLHAADMHPAGYRLRRPPASRAADSSRSSR